MTIEPTKEQLAEWDAWVATRPPIIRPLAGRFQPWICLRDRETGNGHYIVTALEEPEGDGPATIRIAHGADSFMPGFQVFGVDPDTLTPCGCGEWAWPSEEQADASMARVDAFKDAAADAGLKILPGLKLVPADPHK
jgi:hypothetical protein